MSAGLLCLSDYPPELVGSWVQDLGVGSVVAPRGPGWREDPAVASAMASAAVVVADAARQLLLDADALGALRSCRLVVVPAVGTEGSVDLVAAAAAGIPVVGAPGYNAAAVADWTVWAVLQALRSPADLRTAGWRSALGRELGAVTVGLLGRGAIGRAVEQRLRGFGTRVLHHTRHDDGEGWVPLTELFASADVVSLHVPLTADTRGLVGEDLLALMPERSVLVNAARGPVVDEAALLRALRRGRPAGAVLDVFDTEPLPEHHPLRALPQVFLSPHAAAGTEQARARVREIVRQHVRAALGG